MKFNFLGDSMTEGAGAGVPENMYSYLVCKRFGAEELLFGKSGTRIARQHRRTDPLDDEYFMTRAINMPTDADFTFVLGGTNDYGHGDAPLGERGDKDGYTFYGAFEELVAYLTAHFPKERLCFLLPLPRFGQEDARGEDGRKEIPVAPLSCYVAVEKEILERYGVEYLDFSADFPLPQTRGETALTVDGLHPNPKGYRILAERVIAYLEKKGF